MSKADGVTNPPYSYWPITDRPTVVWPDGHKMAFYLELNIEHFEPGLPGPGYFPPSVFPLDPINQGLRDYGTRVGVWRLIDLFDELGIPVSAAVNSAACHHYPQIIAAGVKRDWAWLAHGITNSKQWNDMDPDEEGRRLDEMIADIVSATGNTPRGWLGPGLTETPNTLFLLGQRGFTYTLDWVADDQVVPLSIDGQRMVAVPFSTEMNDITAYRVWHWTPDQFAKAILDQFHRLYQEAQSRTGVVMSLSLHPYLSGSAFRYEHLKRAIQEIRSHEDVWFPTSDDIADCYMRNSYAAAVESISSQRSSGTSTPR